MLETVHRVQQQAKGTIWEDFLAAAIAVVAEAQRNAHVLSEDFVALKPRFIQANLLYPATPDTYKTWQSIAPEIRSLAEEELKHPEGAVVANVELCTRIMELDLLGLSSNEIIEVLVERAQNFPSPLSFFAECFLNRLTLTATAPDVKLVTTTETFIELLAAIGSTASSDSDTRVIRKELLVHTLFEELMTPYVVPIDSRARADALRKLIDRHQDAIDQFKKALGQGAAALLDSADDEVELRALLRETVASIEPQLAEIAETDRASVRRVGQRLTESPSLWTTVASIVGVALSTLPSQVSAAFAISGLGALGASALASKRERDAKLRNSPWSLVYHAKRALT